ncbi:MAG: phosphoribosylglycinamide formyltransferase [Arcobacteraceae bacterium]
MNLAILASHNGTVLDIIKEKIDSKELDINLSLIITNNSNANVIEKAVKYNIPYRVVNAKLFPEISTDEVILKYLKEAKTDYILLAGYMKKIGDCIIESYPNKIINSHPALLPKYGGVGMYGRYVHEAVIANKENSSGVTIHFVNSHYDEGEIIMQKTIDISPSWSVEDLEQNIKTLEQDSIVEVLQNLAQK